MSLLETYRAHVAERAALGIPPLPLSPKQTEGLIALLRQPPGVISQPAATGLSPRVVKPRVRACSSMAQATVVLPMPVSVPVTK